MTEIQLKNREIQVCSRPKNCERFLTPDRLYCILELVVELPKPFPFTVESYWKEINMVYGTVAVRTIPGKRFPGIEKLTELAKWMSDKYGTPTQVLGNLSGQVYQNHIVTQYENMGHSDEIWEKVLADPEYLAWFESTKDLLVWEGARTNWYTVHD